MASKRASLSQAHRWAIAAKVALIALVVLFLIFSVIYKSIPSEAAVGATWSTGTSDWIGFVVALRNGISYLIGVLAVAMVIAGGVVYITAQGNPNQIGVARDIIISAIAGAALYAFATVLLGGDVGGGLISQFFS
ncbi:hypothetical protein A2V68_01420 [candidate division Kazan bacterium RBG_13_50_9]|uniref:Uncharacterized protein n=1 Tax=candidate division Kazan bacterium RBG_13_50_9 TaxID=1798535 RepID=A0A1F4NRG2_UNCK3|nr:MAG: hypothetical protein A2V68_01420 [candidate division Kazan bacterium RBG_13_50_9]